MGYSPDLTTLYPLLEGSVVGDPDNAVRIYEFDAASASFADEIVGFYELDDPSHAIGDMTPINDNEFIIIERDGRQGEEAAFKKLFKVDLSQVDADGFVEKTELVDLLRIADPDDLNNDGETTFSFPFVTIEDVIVIDEITLLVANDNNYPFSIGRGPDIDNNEIIQIELDEPLNLDPDVGMIAEVGLTVDKTTVSEDADTYTLTFTLDEAAPEGGLRVVWSEVDSDNAFGDIEFPPTLTNASNLESLTPEGDELARSAITIDEGETSATATFITVADETTEGDETTVYSLIDEIGYALTDDNSVTVTIEDTSIVVTPPPLVREPVFGSLDGDTFDAAVTEGFSGTDELTFGGADNDLFDTSNGGGGNRLYGQSGNDDFLLGSKDRALGGAGDDRFFFPEAGGNNTITGGAGADQFWIVTAEIPESANIITDFDQLEGDVLGIGGLGIGFDQLTLSDDGGDAIVAFEGNDLARLLAVDFSSLSVDSFAFA